jgi:hypothetical protein
MPNAKIQMTNQIQISNKIKMRQMPTIFLFVIASEAWQSLF